MNKIIVFTAASFLFVSCSNKLTRDKADAILQKELPYKVWQTKNIELRTLENYSYAVQQGLLKQLPPDQDNSGYFSGGLQIAITDNRNKYELTESGELLVVNKYLKNNLVEVKSHYIDQYKVNSIFFPNDRANEAEVEVQIGYAVTEFTGQNFGSVTVSEGGHGTMCFSTSYFKTLKITFRKYDDGWHIDNKDEISKAVKNINGAKLNMDMNTQTGGVCIEYIQKAIAEKREKKTADEIKLN